MLAPGFFDHVNRVAILLKQRLAEIKDRYPSVIAEVRGEGLLIGLKALVPAGELVDALRAEKMLTVAAGDNVVRLLPPLIISETEMADGVTRLDRACGRLSANAKAPDRMSAVRHFLDLIDIPSAELRRMIDAARALKAKHKTAPGIRAEGPLAGKTLAMIFERPSTRTRVSFEVAMRQLGGDTILLTAEEMQLGRGETLADTARVLSRYIDAIMIRTLNPDDVAELARHASVPVINGLTRRSHPCQVMADVMTFEEHRGPIRGRTVAWTGDSNNVLTSWLHAAERFAFQLRVATPPELAPKKPLLDWIKSSGAAISARHRSGRGGQGRGLRRHRHLGVDGRPQRRAPPQPSQALSGQCPADGARQAGRTLHALPAGASRRRGHRRGDGWAEFGRVRRSREPAARAKGHFGVVPARQCRLTAAGVGARRPQGLTIRPSSPIFFGHEPTRFCYSRSRARRKPGSMTRSCRSPSRRSICAAASCGSAPAVDAILGSHDYPVPVAKLLGEAIVLTVMLGSSLKFEGRFILQTQSDGPVRMLVVDFTSPGNVRACARFDADRVAAAIAANEAEPGKLLGHGHLAMTIDQGPEMSRYQGLVPLEGGDLEHAAHEYFLRSEQIPTRVRLAVGEEFRAGRQRPALACRRHSAAVPAEFGRTPASGRYRPGDAPPGTAPHVVMEDEAWVEGRSLVATVDAIELIDPELSSERLAYRLFHERGVRVFPRGVRQRAMHLLARQCREHVEELFAGGSRRHGRGRPDHRDLRILQLDLCVRPG